MAKLDFQANRIESQDNKVSVMTIGTVDGENADNRSYPSVAAVSNAVLNKSTEILDYMQSQVDSAVSYVLTSVFPIGYVLTTFDENDYTNYLGFKWELISDKFLLATTAETGTTGGESRVTLTTSELPSHNHSVFVYYDYPDSTTVPAATGMISSANLNWSASSRPNKHIAQYGITLAKGGNESHNNMPPYITVRMWRRVS